ncbi:MAG: phosphatidylglycerophosphatase A [Chlorobiaceae bacterium]
MKRAAARILSTCFGLGYFPAAPGTVTSIGTVILFIAIPLFRELPILLISVVLATALGIWAAPIMEEEYGEDPSVVTIDEFAGQLLALAALPAGVLPAIGALLFFRFFDIAKPGPVDAAQRLPGGWGIMADDLLAGLLANLSVRALLLLLGAFHLFPPL